MYIVANFENSLNLELAISELEKNGVARNKILAVPLSSKKKEMVFDTINKADGISNLDNAMIIGTACMVLGTIYGFVLTWGPIIWGLIGLILGMLLGFLIDIIPKKNKNKNNKANKEANSVMLLISCSSKEHKEIEKTIKDYFPIGIGKIELEEGDGV